MQRSILKAPPKRPVYISSDTHARVKAHADRKGLILWVYVERVLSEAVQKSEAQPQESSRPV